MARRPGTKNALDDSLLPNPRANNVLKAFAEARSEAPGFLLSCGVLPELSECVSERLNRVVESLAAQWFAGERHQSNLQSAIRKVARTADAAEQITTEVTDLNNAETTAAYLFGLAVGMSIGALPNPIEP